MKSAADHDQMLVRQIRSRFANVTGDPFTGRRIYFENAGGTLKLKSIFPLLATLTALPDNSGRDNPSSKRVDQALAEGRQAAAALLGAKSGQIVAEQSTTSLMFRLLRTLARNVKGTNLVTSNLDHASVFDGTRIVATQYGHECRIASLDPRSGMVPVEAVMRQIDKGTVALTIIHSSNILGTKNRVKEIVRAVRAINPKTFIILDGAQHASHGLVDVEDYGADAYVFVPYKTFSKLGISFAHLADRFAELPHDNLLGKPKTAWDLGTREVAAYACLDEVVKYLGWLAKADGRKVTTQRSAVVQGMTVVDRLETALMQAFLHGAGKTPGLLQLDGVTVHGQTDRLAEREAIFAVSVRGWKTAALVDYFGQNGITLNDRVQDAYSGHTMKALGVLECIRVSACHYNSVGEVKTFLQLLAALQKPRP
jgi:selenocysteine lyase/cysteine desulfurase